MYIEANHFATCVTDTQSRSKIDPITVRSISPADGELQRAFFNSLSSQSRFMRFMGTMGEIPTYLLRILSSVTAENHMAYMLTTGSGDNIKMIGEARLVIREDNKLVADFALALMDGYQGKGLANKLMLLLETVAAQKGIEQIIGHTLCTNEAMKKLAQRFQYNLKSDACDARAIIMRKSLEPLALCA